VPDSVLDMPEPSSRPARSRRAAWVLVIIMTGLLVLALSAVIFGFVRQARLVMAARAAKAQPAIPATPKGAAAAVTLAPGARIVSAGTDAGKLVLHVQTRDGAEVEIIDLATGKLTGQVKTSQIKTGP
jgi:hypothetical protein